MAWTVAGGAGAHALSTHVVEGARTARDRASGAARAIAGGVQDLNHRRRRFLEELEALRASQDALPPRGAAVWRDPLASTRLLQLHLAAAVLGLDADEEGKATPGAALDKWQLATLLPFVRRRELLVLAPTGSGKSFIAANYVQFFLARHLSGRAADGVAPPVARIILAVRDETQLRDQFTKISTSQVYLRGLGDLAEAAGAAAAPSGAPAPGAPRKAWPKNKHISVGIQPVAVNPRPVAIMTFVQLGNFFQKARLQGRTDFSKLLVIVDEVHELADPKEAAAGWAASIVVLNEVLDQRAQLPYEERFLLVGMTATPPTDVPEQLARLLGWFTAPNYTNPFRAEELVAPAGRAVAPAAAAPAAPGGAALPAPTLAARKACALPEDARPCLPVSLRRFVGVSLFVYSVDRNRSRYASWSSPEPTALLVPTERKLTITGRKGGQWTRKGIDHHANARGALFAEAVVGLLAADVKKTLVMLDGNSACRQFAATLRGRPEMARFTLLELRPDDSAAAVEAAKTAFDRAEAQSVVLVANRKTYGVGHSFWATDESQQAGRGARRVVYPPSWDVSKIVQVEGRAKRRGTHAGYADRAMRAIDRVVLVAVGPLAALSAATGRRGASGVADAGAGAAPEAAFPFGRPVPLDHPWVLYAARHAGLATCHTARLQLNVAERSSSLRLFAALFYSALSARLLWNWRPDALGDVTAPGDGATKESVRDAVRRELAMGLAAAQRASKPPAADAPRRRTPSAPWWETAAPAA